MIKSVELENVGPIKELKWNSIAPINLLIGGNGTGKTFLLKILYTLIRSSEEYQRGKDPRKFDQVLSDKIYWTFQVDKFSELISKGNKILFANIVTNYGNCKFSFGDSTTKTIKEINHNFDKRESNSVFIPAKEVLSILSIISHSREQLQEFGFDDTYFDLAKALSNPSQQGRNFQMFAEARADLEIIIGGKLKFNKETNQYFFSQSRYKYPINIISEGIKKLSILDVLLGNRYISNDSHIFIDEPESAMHPSALNRFLDILTRLSQKGIQIIMASHSYFTVKKLYLIAKKQNMSIPVLSFSQNMETKFSDLKDGMPDNSIIDESIKLYEEEIDFDYEN